MDSYDVNGLPLPPLLVERLRAGLWRHPGDKELAVVVPSLHEPVDFLQAVERMRRESSGSLADVRDAADDFHMARSSSRGFPIPLPWLDVDLSVFIAVNRVPGDDVAIVLDYRTSRSDPRVVASDWDWPDGCHWVEVAPTFSEFLRLIEV